MKFYSDITKKLYDSAEACEKGEAEYKKAIDEAEAKKKELAAVKAEKAKAVNEAYQAVRNAQKHYEELRNDFVKQFGAFHFSFKDPLERFTFWEDMFTF